MRRIAAATLWFLSASALAQTAVTGWTFHQRIELRANYRGSRHEFFALKFPFPPSSLPSGQTVGFEETVDAGRRAELSVAQMRLDAGYGDWFLAHAQVHAQDKYRRNPTSDDRKIDADELWLRLGLKPEFLDRPEHTSLFLQMGKFPKMERQPIRLLESYGLAATSFNRFEDVGFMTGGTIRRNLYWRVQATSGNPFYFRDSNALAGDHGTREMAQPFPNPQLKSGFPILYNTETEGYVMRTEHVQFGQGVGYRWQNESQTFGFDAIAFHYRRRMVPEDRLTGTLSLADLRLLEGPPGFGISLPISGNRKEETGGRVYAEWRGLTSTIQFTKQSVAGLHRQGEEFEAGYRIAAGFGPSVGGESLVQSIQPAFRLSALQNRFKGPRTFIAPSVWWNWVKLDYGIRIGFARNVDLTVERAKHNVVAPKRLDLTETLATLRIRI